MPALKRKKPTKQKKPPKKEEKQRMSLKTILHHLGNLQTQTKEQTRLPSETGQIDRKVSKTNMFN